MTKQMMMLCEARLSLEKQGANAEPTGKISARATTWGPREGADGRRFYYKPEGFMKWAEEFSKSGRPLPMYVNHEADAIPVGEWTDFEFDEDGMTASGRLYLNTTQGSDLYQVMTESPAMFGGVSVGAYADEYQWVTESGEVMGDDCEEGYFQITNGGLREVSVVMYPNNPKAEVSKLEFFLPDGSADLRILEQALRDVGLSKSEAVAAASVFKRAIEQREAVKEAVKTAPTQREADAEATKELMAALERRELSKLLSKRIK